MKSSPLFLNCLPDLASELSMMKAKLIPYVVCVLLVIMSSITLAQDIQPEKGNEWTTKKSQNASQFMISAANPIAAKVGYDVLKRGGTAIDAAVSVQLMLNLVEPQSSGLGGGTFLLYWDALENELLTYDGRETAPAAASPDYFLNSDGEPMGWWKAVVGGRSVGVPGTLRLLETAHSDHGKLAWKDLFTPTIDLARNGFKVSRRMAASIEGAKDRGLKDFESARAYFFDDEGKSLAEGSILRNPQFADTLEAVARQGSDAFYEGALARAIVETVKIHGEKPGLLELDDLASYEVKKRPPVCHPYRTFRVCGMGPPSSGALTIGQILGLLEHFDLPNMGMGADAVHLYSEAAKLAYADRSIYMADSDFIDMPTRGLLDADYLKQRASLIKVDSSIEKAQPGTPPWPQAISYAADQSAELPGTSHISIIDKYGNIVSMTTSIETGFGSRLMVGGFLLNNQLTDFSFKPFQDGLPIANRVEARKRPRSSMAPTIVFNPQGRPVLVIGSPGGSRIINYVAKTIVAVLDWKMNIQDAISLGHFSNRNGGTDLELNTTTAKLQLELENRGQVVSVRDLNSGLQGIYIHDDSTLSGGADPRREGIVMGD